MGDPGTVHGVLSSMLEAQVDAGINVKESSVVALAGGQSSLVAISGVSVQSAVVGAARAIVSPSVDCFFRHGTNPTALADGTDQLLYGGNQYRITGIEPLDGKLAFITTGAAGTVHLSPGA